MIDPAAPKDPTPRNAAAQAFARTQGAMMRLRPQVEGGWQADGPRIYAPEEFDVLWYHQGDDPGVVLPQACLADLSTYIENGGTLLLSGAAGKLVNDLGLEPTAVRVLAPTAEAYVSGIVVVEKHRGHPIFKGFDSAKPILLTSLGGNALADFFGTMGPSGELLAGGNAGLGERPLVEYKRGAGRVLFVGWRLPDFTTALDAYRPNLERLFGNMIRYLAQEKTNRARLVPPSGKSRYRRVLGVPFLLAEKPAGLDSGAIEESYRGAVVAMPAGSDGDVLLDQGVQIEERSPGAKRVSVEALGLTLTSREKPASQFVAARRAEEEAEERRTAELIKGLKVMKPEVKLLPAPLKPLRTPQVEQSVLLGRSAFMAPGDGLGDIEPVYEPIEDGGFRIKGSRRQFNRMIVQGQNRVWTGDTPIFRMDTGTGNSCYSSDRIFPLWPRADSQAGQAMPSMGTLRIGVPGEAGKVKWLDELPDTVAVFRPGYTSYDLAGGQDGWKASVVAAPSMNGHGMICRVEFDRPTPLVWQFGGIWWLSGEHNANQVEVLGVTAQITEANLPNGLVLAGWDGKGEGRAIAAAYGKQAQFSSSTPQRVYHIVAVWGVTACEQEKVRQTAARLETTGTAGWAAARDRMKEEWLDCFVRAALDPQKRFESLMEDPAGALKQTQAHRDQRRGEFQIRTPDARLTALVNWERCRSEYHRKGPGLYLGEIWQMYSHISTGWYGKQWGGDHEAIGDCLRLYGAMQREDGFIRWVSPSLVGFQAENNTPYWVDQVWWHYAWTGDKQFVRDLWPIVRKAVECQRKLHDPDGDGLFQDWYEYWNCDSNGKGPKAAAPSVMSWAMLDRAARLGEAIGESQAAGEYRALADKTRERVFAELWKKEAGRLGDIGADDIWRGHPQIWEEYLAINAGLLKPNQGLRAMRWLASHYGFEPRSGVHLLACSDWFPIRWSTQWVPTGDMCLAVLAGMKCGDVGVWWPYLQTAVGSAFKSDFPGINMGISNAGAGGGDREDVDSVDPYVHMAVRGLFGIEPALHEGRIDICPAFPAEWKEASIRTPDVSYEYQRTGDRATFNIRTPKPLIKRVRANLTGPEVVTPAETESVVTVELGPVAPLPKPSYPPPTILAEQNPPTLLERGMPIMTQDRGRQVLFDLSGAFNVTPEDFTATKFIYDSERAIFEDGVWKGNAAPIAGWWGNPPLSMQSSPRVLQASTGAVFLTSGRPRPGLGSPPKSMLALSSWRPYPWPGGATIPVGLKCERLWLLLQNYVHPMKNYIPNGEVVLTYDGGRQTVEPLIPPFNLDCYFQHFSRTGTPVPLGRLGQPPGYGFVHQGMMFAHADALEIASDPDAVLQSLELRATCSEGAIGLLGMTALEAGK
jgi:hypothetical protein